jgi:hypothetical protein
MESFSAGAGRGLQLRGPAEAHPIDDEDFHLDLLFYNRKLRRLVAVELKVGEFKAAYKGQMELYLRWLDKHEREPEEASPLGIILCTGKKREQIELLELDKSGIHVAEYLTALPPQVLVLVERLQQATQRAQLQCDIATTEHVLALAAMKATQSMPGCQLYRFLGRDIEHDPVRRNRAVPQRHHHLAARCKQSGQRRHANLALRAAEVHPHCRQKNEVEAPRGITHSAQRRQVIVHPFDGQRCVPLLAFVAKPFRRLDRHDLVPEASKRSSIAPGTRADIEHGAGAHWKQMHYVSMDISEGDAFILVSQDGCILAVAGSPCDFIHGASDLTVASIAGSTRDRRHQMAPWLTRRLSASALSLRSL